MQSLGTWFSRGIGSVRLMAGLDFEGLLQPKQFYVSVSPSVSLVCSDAFEHAGKVWCFTKRSQAFSR